jgi:hypothetical protein
MKNRDLRNHLMLAAVILVAGLTSCEKIIDISIPDHERKIVVNGLMTNNDTVRVHLSRSRSVLESDSLNYTTGGDVRLYLGSDLIGKFREETNGFYFLPDFIPQVGQSYRLTASDGELKPVEALAVLPPQVPILSVDTATMTGEWGQQELRLTIKFNDPAGIKNVYGFGVDMIYKEYSYETMTWTGKKLAQQAYLYGNDDRFLKDESINFEGKFYFEDLLFDGMTKSVEFGLSDFAYMESDTIWLSVNLEQLDQSYYKYILSYNAYQNASGNPFAEPVQVYTNVVGGYGIFSGTSVSRYPIVTKGGMRKIGKLK